MFNVSISLSRDMLLVGASQVLSSDADLGDKFGLALTVRNHAAVIGAPFDDDNGDEAGAAYVFGFDGVEPSTGAAYIYFRR